jgi:hypothetical protein
VTAATYTPCSSPARALDEIAAWVQQSPDQLGCCAFVAALMAEQEGLPFQSTFDRVLRAGIDSGVPEGVARKWVFRGFLAHAVGFYAEPPAKLLEEPDP